MTRKEILAAAEKCVCGDRERDHGNPEDNFKKIGALWTIYTDYAYKFDANDVAAMMALLKIARASANPEHIDSWIDGAGYLACGGEISTKGEAQS